MCAHHHTLNRRQVIDPPPAPAGHVPLRDHKRKVTPSTLWAVVLTAAAGVTSIHATCGWLKELPSEETVRKALYTCLPDFAELQRQLNRAWPAGYPEHCVGGRNAWRSTYIDPLPWQALPRSQGGLPRLRQVCDQPLPRLRTAYVVLKGQRHHRAAAVTKGEPPSRRSNAPAAGPLGGVRPRLCSWTVASTAWR